MKRTAKPSPSKKGTMMGMKGMGRPTSSLAKASANMPKAQPPKQLKQNPTTKRDRKRAGKIYGNIMRGGLIK